MKIKKLYIINLKKSLLECFASHFLLWEKCVKLKNNINKFIYDIKLKLGI